jgi:hypothetical protein
LWRACFGLVALSLVIPAKDPNLVIPAEAGIHFFFRARQSTMDSGLRRNDGERDRARSSWDVTAGEHPDRRTLHDILQTRATCPHCARSPAPGMKVT